MRILVTGSGAARLEGMAKNGLVAVGEWERLEVWRLAHGAVLRIYHLKKDWPPEEKFGLTAQLSRAAISVSNNIAEGKGRLSNADLRHFLVISRGSAEEVRNLLLIAKDLGYLAPADYKELNQLYIRIRRMLNGMIVHFSNHSY